MNALCFLGAKIHLRCPPGRAYPSITGSAVGTLAATTSGRAGNRSEGFCRSSNPPPVHVCFPLFSEPSSSQCEPQAMPNPTEFFNWYIRDEGTGERRLTTYKLSRPDAERAFPGAEPDLQTREVRNLPGTGEETPNSRPGRKWS